VSKGCALILAVTTKKSAREKFPFIATISTFLNVRLPSSQVPADSPHAGETSPHCPLIYVPPLSVVSVKEGLKSMIQKGGFRIKRRTRNLGQRMSKMESLQFPLDAHSLVRFIVGTWWNQDNA